MVASGLTQRTEVSQYRLAPHLILALVIFSAIVWTVQRMKARPVVTAPVRLRFFSQMLLGLTFLQIYFGALVAGLRAGRAYNTWPTIDGAFIPSAERLFFETPWWRNLFDNVLTVQFEHRMTAYLLLAVALWQAIDALRARAAGVVVGGAWAMVAAVLLQATLGILTLLGQVPIDLALSHQAVAIVVLTIAVVNVERLSPRSARRMSEELAAARAG
jgi:cytochrome c oxidase assembly protein subunit 15